MVTLWLPLFVHKHRVWWRFIWRKAQAWVAWNKLEKIWKSKLDRTWTWMVTQALEERMNGCYTQLLRRVLCFSWRDHETNKKVYGDILPCQSHSGSDGYSCWPLLAHIWPARLQIDNYSGQNMDILSEAGNNNNNVKFLYSALHM